MADHIGGKRRYARKMAPAVPTITTGSADNIVSTVDEAIGFAPSITLLVCCAASTSVCDQRGQAFYER